MPFRLDHSRGWSSGPTAHSLKAHAHVFERGLTSKRVGPSRAWPCLNGTRVWTWADADEPKTAMGRFIVGPGLLAKPELLLAECSTQNASWTRSAVLRMVLPEPKVRHWFPRSTRMCTSLLAID